MEDDAEICKLCEREQDLTFHHLIPKKAHNKSRVKRMHTKEYMVHEGIDICWDCHRMLHRTYRHELLALEYYTLELIKQNPKVIRFISWVSKQNKSIKY
jgi:hypothetical protein